MALVNVGSFTVEHKGENINPNDRMMIVPAIAESITLDGYVTATNTDLITTADAVATCTRALKVLTADKIAVAHNMSRALDIVTCATAGDAANIKVGDAIEINSGAAGTVIEKIDDTYLRVNASGTIGAAAATWQRPMFKNVHAGATLVLATGTTTVYVESKTSDFAVVTTTSGTITTGLLTSYKNIESLLMYKEDDSKGTILGVAMESYTAAAYALTSLPTAVKIKWFGNYNKLLTTTVDHATAGTVPESVHVKAVRLYHTTSTRRF